MIALSSPNLYPWTLAAVALGVIAGGYGAALVAITLFRNEHKSGWWRYALVALSAVGIFCACVLLVAFLYHVAWVDYERDLVDRWGQLVECVMRAPEGRAGACIP